MGCRYSAAFTLPRADPTRGGAPAWTSTPASALDQHWGSMKTGSCAMLVLMMVVLIIDFSDTVMAGGLPWTFIRALIL